LARKRNARGRKTAPSFYQNTPTLSAKIRPCQPKILTIRKQIRGTAHFSAQKTQQPPPFAAAYNRNTTPTAEVTAENERLRF